MFFKEKVQHLLEFGHAGRYLCETVFRYFKLSKSGGWHVTWITWIVYVSQCAQRFLDNFLASLTENKS